jgi:hypothetical protein
MVHSLTEEVGRMSDGSKSSRRFQLILIKSSHYDDEGYLIRWWRAMSPSNSLASIYGIADDCAERKVLGSRATWARHVRIGHRG